MSDVILVFWLSAAFVAYVYVGYPLLLQLAVWLRAHHCGLRIADCGLTEQMNPPSSRQSNHQSHPKTAIHEPQCGVSIVIAARNEASRLATRIENLLSLDFPASQRQIVVVSDGSSDNTLDVLARYAGVVETIALPDGGKAQALNAGVACARFEIVVFADARQTFAKDALMALVEPFTDPSVGAVSGELLLDAEAELFANRRRRRNRRSAAGSASSAGIDRRHLERRRTLGSTVTDGLGMYWRYEKRLRRLESAVDSTVGASGAIYAIRRALWRPLPPETILDDVLTPLRVVLAGYRVAFNEKARAFDRVTIDAQTEMGRKVRTLAGNYQLPLLEPRVLLPWRNRVWLQYVSHKLGRLAVPYALLTLFGASLMLADRSVVYQAALAAQVGFYLLAGYGAVIEAHARRCVSQRDAIGADPLAVREVA